MSNARNLARLLPNTSGQLPDAAMSSGSVLQVVHNNTQQQTITSSDTYVATGLSVTITPSSATSKVLVSTSGGDMDSQSGGRQCYISLARNGVILNAGADAYGAQRIIAPSSAECLDSPNTTSAITYAVYVKTISAGQQVIYNGQGSYATITAMEIAA